MNSSSNDLIIYYAKLFSSSEDVENRKTALTHLDDILNTTKEKFNSAHVKNVFEQAAKQLDLDVNNLENEKIILDLRLFQLLAKHFGDSSVDLISNHKNALTDCFLIDDKGCRESMKSFIKEYVSHTSSITFATKLFCSVLEIETYKSDDIFQLVVILDEIKDCKAFSHDDCQSVNLFCSHIKEIFLSDFSEEQKEFFRKVVSFYTDLLADSNTFSSVIEEDHEKQETDEDHEDKEDKEQPQEQSQEQSQEPSFPHWFSRIQSSLHSFFSSTYWTYIQIIFFLLVFLFLVFVVIALISSRDLPEENLQCTDIARSGYRIRYYYESLLTTISSYYSSFKQYLHFYQCPPCPPSLNQSCPISPIIPECPPPEPCPKCHDCPPSKTCPKCPPPQICPECKSCPPPQTCPECPPPQPCPECKSCPPPQTCPPPRPCPKCSDCSSEKTTIQELEYKIYSLSNQNKELLSLNSTVIQLKEAIQSTNQQLHKKDEQLIQKDSTIQSLQLQVQEVEYYKNQETILTEKNEKQKTQLKDNEVQISNLKQENQDYRNSYTSQQQTIQYQTKQLNEKEEQIRKYQNTNDNLMKKNQHYEEEIRTLKNDLKASRSQYNGIKNDLSSCVFNAKEEKENLQKKNQEMLDVLLNYVSKEIVENCKEKDTTSPATSIYDDKGIIECILVKVNDQQEKKKRILLPCFGLL